jgi:hypothetical protein
VRRVNLNSTIKFSVRLDLNAMHLGLTLPASSHSTAPISGQNGFLLTENRNHGKARSIQYQLLELLDGLSGKPLGLGL